MSEATQAIWACVTADEWISTAEIVDRVPELQGFRSTKMSKVYGQLAKGIKYGLIEKRVIEKGPSGRTTQWRRKA